MEYSDPAPLKFAPPSSVSSAPSLYNYSQPVVHVPAAQPVHQLGHPPYEEMIRRAVMTLNEKDGSSKQKIAKYIENEFHVPPSHTHSYELTYALKQMKTCGQLVMVKHSYMLPPVSPPQVPQTHVGPSQHAVSLGFSQPGSGPLALSLGRVPPPSQPVPASVPFAVILGPSQPAPASAPSQPAPASVSLGLSQPPSSNGQKRKPGRPAKLKAVTSVVSPSPPPVGFAAYSPKQGVPTTNLFGGLTPSATPSYQFGAGPIAVTNVSSMGLVTGPLSNASTVVTVNGAPTMTLAGGSVSNVALTGPVSGQMNTVSSMGVYGGSANNVSSTGHVTGPVLESAALAKVGPSEQVNGSAGVGSKVDYVMVGAGVESSSGPLVVSAVPDSVAQNDAGPSTVLGKRGRGRPPNLVNGGAKKVLYKSAMHVRKGRRGRPKRVAISTISLRPRGRPRKNDGGAIVAVAEASGGGGGVLPVAMPVANIPSELHDRSLGRPIKDIPVTSSLQSEMQLMAYQGLKERLDYYKARTRSVISTVRPFLNESAVVALDSLQDLEELINLDITSVPTYAQSAPVGDLNLLANVQDAQVDDLNAPVNVHDSAAQNIESVPSTAAEDAQLAVQGTPPDAVVAQVTVQTTTVPVQQQEPPVQS